MNTSTVTTDATSSSKRRGRPRSENINRLIRIAPSSDVAIREIGSGSLTTGVMRLFAAWQARVEPASTPHGEPTDT